MVVVVVVVVVVVAVAVAVAVAVVVVVVVAVVVVVLVIVSLLPRGPLQGRNRLDGCQTLGLKTRKRRKNDLAIYHFTFF